MTNEEKIISMLENIQKDVAIIKANSEKTDAEKNREKNIKAFFEAAENFTCDETPEEKAETEALVKYWTAEEDKKLIRCKLNNLIFKSIEDNQNKEELNQHLAIIKCLKSFLTKEEYEKLKNIVGI